MPIPTKIPVSDLPRGELEALAERLLAENAALKQAVAELRAEVAKLKDVKGRPVIKPSGMEQGTEPKPADRGQERSGKGGKAERLAIQAERIVKADVPPGSRFKGYEDFLVQDLVLRPQVTRVRRERWLTPDGRTVTAPMRPTWSATSGRNCAGSSCSSIIRVRSRCHGWSRSSGAWASRSPSGRSCGS